MQAYAGYLRLGIKMVAKLLAFNISLAEGRYVMV
jgi:hypothetical protein